jgi:hypothetical protein
MINGNESDLSGSVKEYLATDHLSLRDDRLLPILFPKQTLMAAFGTYIDNKAIVFM